MSRGCDLFDRVGTRGRFLIGGALNTGLTYALYLGIHQRIGYQLAFCTAYLTGIALSYAINVVLVFRVPPSAKTALAFPAIYFAQYLVQAAMLGWLVENLGVSEQIAALLVIPLVLPITYLAVKLALRGRKWAATCE